MSYYAEPHVLEVQPEPKDEGSFLDIVVQPQKIFCYDVQVNDDVAYDAMADQALETLLWEANRAVVDLIFTQTQHLRNSRNLYYVYDGVGKMYTNQKHGLPEIEENGQDKAIYLLHRGVPMEDMITPPLIRDRANVRAADPEIPPFVCQFFRCEEVEVTFTFDGEIDMANIGDALSRDRHGKDLNDKLRDFFYWLMVESVVESPTVPVGNGDGIPMTQIFAEQYSRLRVDRPAVRVSLHFPDAVEEFAAYPLEALIIMPNQRVPLRQMSHALATAVIEKNLLARRDCKTLKRVLNTVLFNTTAIETLAAFGVTVPKKLKFFTIIPLEPMSVAYWTGMSWKVKDANWSADAKRLKYFRPSVIPMLLIVVDNAVRREHQNVDASVNTFGDRLLEAARAKEVQIQKAEIAFVDGIGDLLARNEDAFKHVSLVIYVDDDCQSHGSVKLWERLFETPTLHVSINDVLRLQGSDIDKIVAKTNVKTGGLCYKPNIRAFGAMTPVFVMGLALTVTQPATFTQRRALNNTPSAVAVPERNALPSVIGFCANRAMDAFTYSGDYDFQDGFNDGIIEPSRLTDLSKWAFERFLENAGECQSPAIVFRYCQSESQFTKVLDAELRHIEKGFVKATRGQMPKFALVLLTNEHSKHFWPNDAATAAVSVPGQAVGPGPAVFKGDQREFLMRPYRYETVRKEKIPAKFAQYLVAHNTTGFSPERLRDIAYGLCYSRQSTAFPTHLPEPVHRAHQQACRGRSNLEEYNNLGLYDANNVDAARNALYYRRATNQELVNTCFTA